MKAPVIELYNVTYTYETENRPVLNNLSLVVEPGEWVAVTGRSGSGKSALCQLLNGYLPRAGGGERQGIVRIGGIDPLEAEIAEIAVRIGVVFQDPDAQLVQGRVEDEVAFGPENLYVPAPVIAGRVSAALDAVRLTEQRTSSVHALSGGQRQRTGIAAVLSMQTPVIVFDDAASSLDRASREQLLALLQSLHAEGRTLLTVSSRVDAIAAAAGRLVVLEGGAVALDGPAAELVRTGRDRLAQLGVLPRGAGPGGAQPAAQPSAAPAAAPAALPRGAGPDGAQPAAQPGAARGAAQAALPRGAGPDGAQPAAQPSAARGAGPMARPRTSLRGALAASGQGEPPLLELRNLTFRYPGSAAAVLRGINLSLRPGEWALICGENGSGKTTMSQLLMNLLPMPRGFFYWEGKEASRMKTYELAEQIGYLFQEPEHQFVASNVLDEILFGPARDLSLEPGASVPEEVRLRAERLLEAAGLSGRLDASPYLLSGGEKRLLGAAAQFMSPKKLYILDEPTAGTDYAGTELLINLCRAASGEGAALLIITHEPERFEDEADTLFTLDQGEISRSSIS
ncbi:ABC transporter ATP-binding protein [Paenibacillus sp. YPG26]|uniref:ABC transporter ATP-binding protein n=1 Tax=Paenibacillus sp. YPG26 TaxID=2878915 RepID=UPI00203BF1BE|nr:ABC transporter ATP-binding protein [Paenibacillus sp. YPG26]USB33811.1 energy-coupling factor ABC transporter ATP-binding protein [Paenibacillus sp. YPG26]